MLHVNRSKNLKRITVQLLRKAWPYIALASVTALLIFVKLGVLNHYATPPSSDMGNHLTVLHAYLGTDVTNMDIKLRYPPLYFLLVLAPLTSLFPVFTALKISAALVSSIIVLPFFFIVRRLTKNNLISLFVAGLFGFTEGYSDMIGWGGIPNFLGIFFMLWSFYFMIDVIEEHSKRSALLAGLFLSLTAGTHHLTFLYYLIALGLFLTGFLIVKRKDLIPTIRDMLPMVLGGFVFSLPYLPVYVMIMERGVFGGVNDILVTTQPININAIGTVVLYIFRGSLTVWIAVAVAGFFSMWESFQRRSTAGLISCFVLGSLVLFLIFSYAPARAVYFLYVPIVLVFGIALAKFFSGELSSQLHKKSRIVFALALITVITSILLTNSYSKLNEAASFYNVLGDEQVEALNWLKGNTELDAITITNDMRLAWWIEGYAMRKSYMPTSYAVYVYSDQVLESDTANRIMSGNHIIENGYLRISDFFPTGFHNPKISLNLGYRYLDIIYVNDGQITLQFSPTRNPQVIWNEAPLYSKSKSMQADISPDIITLNYSYAWGAASVIRTVEVASRPEVTITYNVTLIGSFMRSFTIPISVSPNVNVEGVNQTGNTMKLALRDSLDTVATSQVALLQTTGNVIGANFTYWDKRSVLPTCYFTFNTTSSNLYAKFSVSVEPQVRVRKPQLQYFISKDLVKSSNITYVVLSKIIGESNRDIHRFTYYPDDWTRVFENREILILRAR